MVTSSLRGLSSGSLISAPTASMQQTQAAPVGDSEAAAAGDSTQISTLARQLSNAAARAAARDASMSQSALSILAEKILHSLSKAEISPGARTDTDDPALLARSIQAAQHYRELCGEAFPRTTPNPFAGLPSDQLLLIAYDQGKDFTLNERVVALHSFNRREDEWASRMIDQANAEFAATGTYFNNNKENYEYFKSLPLIEQARRGGDAYEAAALQRIATSLAKLGERADVNSNVNWFRRFIAGLAGRDTPITNQEFLQKFREALHGRDPFEAIFGVKGRTLNEILDVYKQSAEPLADAVDATTPLQTGVAIYV